MFGGAWGVLAAGLFSKPDLLERAFPNNTTHPGWFYGDGTLFGIQILGVMFVFAWAFTIMGAFFYFLNYMGWLRIDPLEEEVGMDISRHKGSAYTFEGAKDEHVKELENSRGSVLEDRSNSRRGVKKSTNETSTNSKEPGEPETPEVEA
jgi:Amt family ammonium transporter